MRYFIIPIMQGEPSKALAAAITERRKYEEEVNMNPPSRINFPPRASIDGSKWLISIDQLRNKDEDWLGAARAIELDEMAVLEMAAKDQWESNEDVVRDVYHYRRW